ncbi:MAG: histidinol dehydrogenase [Leptospiraceae bacterium]|nr:histidinol dehydrogenase [Leptospiraceae bacterium]MCK6381295.1 histidinol dehydrogenase [Leptospiraceae bacterium]
MPIPIREIQNGDYKSCVDLIHRAKDDLSNAIQSVIPIIEDVRKNGDEALVRLSKKFDGVRIKNFVVFPEEENLSVPLEWEKAFHEAKENITKFHEAQLRNTLEVQIKGNRLGVKYSPVDSVAVYAPGGKALYPSSVLMGVIPAKLAGVKNIHLFTPPGKEETIPLVYKYAAKICGVDKIYTLGGAQAIAGAAYGTETVSPSEFVVGPGNRFVAAAKSYLSGIGKIGIDSPAGPSEVLIIADKTANPVWVAADLLSQAEHGEDSIAILATDDLNLAKKVQDEIEKAYLDRPKRVEMKRASIENNSSILVFSSIAECIHFSNLFAPEHLEIMTKNYNEDFLAIRHAGSVFLGEYSPVAMGDYISGTNHILPTAGLSRIYSSLGVDTFLKRITYQEIQKDSLANMYPFVKTLSEIEGLDEEHGTSVQLRAL